MRLDDFKLESYFARHEFSTPYLLCCSDCETMTVAELLAMDRESESMLADLRLGYTEILGHPILREEISKLYSGISPEEIVVLSGAEEGIFAFANSVLEPGDHVVVQFPAYQSLFEVAAAIGCEVTRWTLDESRSWESDIDALESVLKSNTKLIIINSPHNPTGAIISREDFKRIAEIALERGILLFSDEVYRFSEYDPADCLDGMCDLYERGYSLGVMSKSFGLAGLRLGWIASKDREILETVARFKLYTTICNSAPSEILAITALRNKEGILARNLDIIRRNLQVLDGFFDMHSDIVQWIRPKAGPVAFPHLVTPSGAERICAELRERAGILLLPGTVFDFGDSHFRIGFGRRDMPQALERLERHMSHFSD